MTIFKYVQRGDRIEIPTAEWHNALVDAIRHVQSTERGFQDNSGLHTKRYTEKGDVVDVVLTDDVDEYSIFTIDDDAEGYIGTGTLGTGVGETEQVAFDLIIPVAFSRKVRDNNDSIYIVNHHTACATDSRYILPILGTHRPYLVHYDPDDGLPELGQPIGPKPATYVLSTNYTGCLCVSAPDTVEELIWVVRAPGGSGGGTWYVGSPVSDIAARSSGNAERANHNWASTGIIDVVFNPHDVTLEAGEHIRWTNSYVGWEGWIAEPWHYTECPDDAGTGTGSA